MVPALALSALAALVPPDAMEPLRLPPDVRPSHYRVELAISPALPAFRGKVEIDVELARPLDRVWLNASELTVTTASVRVGGKTLAARAESSGKDYLTLATGAEVPAGSATLVLEYEGRIASDTSSGVFHQREGEADYVFSDFEAIDARHAFPCFDEPSYKASWDVALRIPDGLRGFSNGPQTEDSPGKDGTHLVRFARTPPLPTYLVAFAVGPFDVVEAGRAGRNQIPVRIVTPRGRAADARFAAEVTPGIVAALEDYFGSPFPFAKLDQVVIPLTVTFSAMENAGMVTYSARTLLSRPEEDTVARQRRCATVIAHELAHQWFGDLVTMAWWDDLWLNEGFASWMEDKVMQRFRPAWGGAAERVSARGWAMATDALATARRVRQPIATNDDIENAFDGITYQKGQALLEMFEAWVGEEAFRKGVQSYLASHAWGSATSADFLTAVSKATRPGLAAAFSSFLDQPGIPLVTATLQCGEGAPRLALEQRRYTPSGSRAAAETWQVPVCVRHPAGRDCVLLDGPKGSVALAGEKGCPDWVVVNDGGSGYYRTLYRGDLARRLVAQGGRLLAPAERVGLLSDAAALAASGEMGEDEALRMAAELVREPERHVVATAARVVGGLQDDLVPEDRQASYVRFVRTLFCPLAHELGLQPKAGEDEDTKLLRPQVVELCARQGEDPALRTEAAGLARRWLDDRRGVAAEALDEVLEIAAESGGAPLFERLLAAARASQDRRERGRLLAALASFSDPVLARRAFALTLSDDFDVRETVGLLTFALRGARPRIQRLAYQFLVDNYDAVAARVPREARGYLPALAGAGCEVAARAAAEDFWKQRVQELEGGPRVLAQALERISLCAARREAQLPAIREFLRGY